MAASTSFRISDTARTRLASRAAREGSSATACWISSSSKASISATTRGSFSGVLRTSGAWSSAAGPDVWEVIGRLQELGGSEEQRISLLGAESDLHPRLIRIALDYATDHADEIRGRIDRNRATAEESRSKAGRREALLA